MTHYYKALLLDYPNAQDRLEFRRKKEEGVLPQKARIGGLIEIHGKGDGMPIGQKDVLLWKIKIWMYCMKKYGKEFR